MKPKTVGRVFDGHSSANNAPHLCIGLPKGALVMTAHGPAPIETLRSGDQIITRNGGLQPLLARDVENRDVQTVLFTQNCFGDAGPAKDQLLPADQPVLIRDWRARVLFGQSQGMARAGMLIDGEFVTDLGVQRLELHRLAFDRPRIVYCSGLELGTTDDATLPRRAVA